MTIEEILKEMDGIEFRDVSSNAPQGEHISIFECQAYERYIKDSIIKLFTKFRLRMDRNFTRYTQPFKPSLSSIQSYQLVIDGYLPARFIISFDALNMLYIMSLDTYAV